MPLLVKSRGINVDSRLGKGCRPDWGPRHKRCDITAKALSLDPGVKAWGLHLRVEALELEFDMQGW